MDLSGVLDLLKYLVPTGLTGLGTWFFTRRAERRSYQTHLYELSAEVTSTRVLLDTYVMEIRAKFHYLTKVARERPDQIQLVLDGFRAVLPDALVPEVTAYMETSNQQWFYRVGAPPWPTLQHMEEPARRQTAMRALPDPSLLDAWDRAVGQLERNRDHLVEQWQRIVDQPGPVAPGDPRTVSTEEWSKFNEAQHDHILGIIFEMMPLARGMLVGADEVKRLGGELSVALDAALKKATRHHSASPPPKSA